MSRPLALPTALKRKRPEAQSPAMSDAEAAILELIRSKKDLGIWTKEIKYQTNLQTRLPDTLYTKVFKSLLAKNLIKEVVNAQNKSKKYYMAVEFEPSKELSGGDFYSNGDLDLALIDALKRICYGHLRSQKVATREGIHSAVVGTNILNFNISTEQVGEVLNSMVLDNDIIEVKSTGLGDYYSIPQGTTCYRAAGVGTGRAPTRMATFASIPCGSCPRINLCTSDGIISPSTCAYYTKWLDIKF